MYKIFREIGSGNDKPLSMESRPEWSNLKKGQVSAFLKDIRHSLAWNGRKVTVEGPGGEQWTPAEWFYDLVG